MLAWSWLKGSGSEKFPYRPLLSILFQENVALCNSKFWMEIWKYWPREWTSYLFEIYSHLLAPPLDQKALNLSSQCLLNNLVYSRCSIIIGLWPASEITFKFFLPCYGCSPGVLWVACGQANAGMSSHLFNLLPISQVENFFYSNSLLNWDITHIP